VVGLYLGQRDEEGLEVKPIRRLTGGWASLTARALTRVNRNASRRFAAWYGKQTIRHPNYLGTITWDQVVRTNFGMLMRAQFQECIGRKLILREMHEPELTERIQGTLRAGDAFIDVGANIGYYTLLASRLVGEQGLVFAFEPSPANLARLAENVTLNGCRNVLLFSEALSDLESIGKLSLPWAINSGVASLGNGPSAEEGCYANGFSLTATRRLDAILGPLQPKQPIRVVKIDAEGHEPQVLRGMETLLRSSPGMRVACEISPKSYSVDDLCGYLVALGFQGEFFEEARWRPIRSDRLPDRLCNAWFWRD
jgi:FkbM family methyltransferase